VHGCGPEVLHRHEEIAYDLSCQRRRVSSTHDCWIDKTGERILVNQASDDDEDEESVAPEAPIDTLDELCDKLLPTVAARIWSTCCWPGRMGDGWKIGDYSFLVISIAPDSGTELYLQFWSEPKEQVLFEVSSGEWSPPSIKYVQTRQREILRSFGFERGGRANNFGKVVGISNLGEAEDAAREVLRILFECFEYRGQWPLEFKGTRSGRAEHAPVHVSVTPDDFAKLLAEEGYDATVTTADGGPLVVLDCDGRRFTARFDGRVADNNLYTVVLLDSIIAAVATDAVLMKLNARFPGITVQMYGDRNVRLLMPLFIGGGVTQRWILGAVHYWWANVRRIARLLKREMKRKRTQACVSIVSSVH
jgi:hypothetical protein